MGLGEVLRRKGNKTFQCGMGLLASYPVLNCFLLVLWHVRYCETQVFLCMINCSWACHDLDHVVLHPQKRGRLLGMGLCHIIHG